MTIRKINIEDNSAIARIIRTSLEEFEVALPGTAYFDKDTDAMYEAFAIPWAAYYIAEDPTGVIGGCGIYPTPELPSDTCELVRLFLSNKARGKGIGRSLIETCIFNAQAFGFNKIYLETMPQLKQAVQLYEKMGFSYQPASAGQSLHSACSIRMIKDIAD
jgi:putative acetyltransferase